MSSPYQKSVPGGGPIANALVFVVGIMSIAVAFVVGIVAFVVVGGLLLVFALGLILRVWWLRRNLKRRTGPGEAEAPGRPDVIEGEFRVVDGGGRRPDGPD